MEQLGSASAKAWQKEAVHLSSSTVGSGQGWGKNLDAVADSRTLRIPTNDLTGDMPAAEPATASSSTVQKAQCVSGKAAHPPQHDCEVLQLAVDHDVLHIGGTDTRCLPHDQQSHKWLLHRATHIMKGAGIRKRTMTSRQATMFVDLCQRLHNNPSAEDLQA